MRTAGAVVHNAKRGIEDIAWCLPSVDPSDDKRTI